MPKFLAGTLVNVWAGTSINIAKFIGKIRAHT